MRHQAISDYYCYYCEKKKVYCQLCLVNQQYESIMDSYTTYYGNYYSQYYGSFYALKAAKVA